MDSSTQCGPLLICHNLAVLAKGSSAGLLGQGQEGLRRHGERRGKEEGGGKRGVWRCSAHPPSALGKGSACPLDPWGECMMRCDVLSGLAA